MTAADFNYSPVILLVAGIFVVTYWHLPKPYGVKHFYFGPIRPKRDAKNIETSSASSTLSIIEVPKAFETGASPLTYGALIEE
jgi:hypothetical protein